MLQRTNFIVPRTLSFKNGHNFQPELIYGKVRVQEPRTFVPATVFYDKKVIHIEFCIK